MIELSGEVIELRGGKIFCASYRTPCARGLEPETYLLIYITYSLFERTPLISEAENFGQIDNGRAISPITQIDCHNIYTKQIHLRQIATAIISS